jgi:dolichol-phosphate mannosyltransferase
MMKLAFDGIISLSTAPLRLALRIGFLLSALSFLGGIVAIVLKVSGAFAVPGWASLIAAISFLGGIQLLTLGIMGEYVARIHDEVRGRPLYLLREVDGAPPATDDRAPSGSAAPPMTRVEEPSDPSLLVGRIDPGSRG